MNADQLQRLQLWGGEAVNWLHALAPKVKEFENDKRIREVADTLFAILDEIREASH